jgi:hypothetical protein
MSDSVEKHPVLAFVQSGRAADVYYDPLSSVIRVKSMPMGIMTTRSM